MHLGPKILPQPGAAAWLLFPLNLGKRLEVGLLSEELDLRILDTDKPGTAEDRNKQRHM